MPKTTFSDFDEFADAINGVAGRFAATGSSEADWWMQFAPVGSTVIQHLQIGGPSAFVGEGEESKLTIGVPVSEPGLISIDGRPLDEHGFVLINQHQPFAVGAQSSMRWSAITLPLNHPDLPLDLLSSKIPARGRATYGQSESATLMQIRALVLRLLSEESRIGFLEGAAARGAEEALLYSATRLLQSLGGTDEGVRIGRPAYSRARVLARALEAIESHRGKSLFLRDLCRATQVSERTLRNIFQQYFGVSPMRLLKVNRLREIRAALLDAEVHGDCVWKIASRFGVWDLSAFAAEYKALFNELPHQTLRSQRPTPRQVNATNATWVRYASSKLMQASAP
jgi:AraC family ethanolamine operon transcriptional activator